MPDRAQVHAASQRPVALKLRQTGGLHGLRTAVMAVLQQADQLAHKRLMADQQHITVVRELTDGARRIALGRQPGHSLECGCAPKTLRTISAVCCALT